MTIELLIQTQDSRGGWTLYPPRPLSEVGTRGIVLSDAQMARLLAGAEVHYGSEWYANVRLARAEHRDTNVVGHCDDCEA